MLDDFELPLVQLLHTEEDQTWVEHPVPALEGSLFQHLGRAPLRVTIKGIMTTPDSLEMLERLRQLYQAAKPVPFVADIMTATAVQEVIIDELTVREIAGTPQRYHYTILLYEYIPTPEPETPPDPGPEPECQEEVGTIEVTVILPEGQTDYRNVVVRLQRTDVEGEAPFEITEQVGGKYRREGVPAGEYRATAIRR